MSWIRKLCREEFRPSALSLSHDEPNLFVESQYGRHFAYVAFRVMWGVYFLCVQLHGFIWRNINFTQLTNWSIVLLTVSANYRAVLAAIHLARHRKGSPSSKSMPATYKISWVLYNVSSVAALVITAAYWSVIYKGKQLNLGGVNAHAINSIYVIIDAMVTGMPVRILHAYHMMVYGTVYIVFTVIYWATWDRKPIYSILDWEEHPGRAVGLSSVLVLAAPVMQAVLFCFTLVRRSLEPYITACRAPSQSAVLETESV